MCYRKRFFISDMFNNNNNKKSPQMGYFDR